MRKMFKERLKTKTLHTWYKDKVTAVWVKDVYFQVISELFSKKEYLILCVLMCVYLCMCVEYAADHMILELDMKPNISLNGTKVPKINKNKTRKPPKNPTTVTSLVVTWNACGHLFKQLFLEHFYEAIKVSCCAPQTRTSAWWPVVCSREPFICGCIIAHDSFDDCLL